MEKYAISAQKMKDYCANCQNISSENYNFCQLIFNKRVVKLKT